jgi:hypothetical protein
VARPDGKRSTWRRDLGAEAARRFKDILRQGTAPVRALPSPPPPPGFEERRPLLKVLRRPEPDDDDQDE